MIHFRRGRVLDVDELRHLLDLTEYQVRALISDNDDPDDFPYHFNYTRRPRRRAASAADREAL